MKRGLTIVIVVLVIVAIGAGLLWYVGNKSLTTKEAGVLGFVKVTQKDTDHDGLSDPEEALWHTDPKNPDTNNDNISDGNSIQKNIDPVKAGSQPITNTDGRIQALVENALSKKGAPLVDISPTEIPPALVLKASDLDITETETVATITKYRDDIRQTLTTFFDARKANPTNESELLNKFIDEGDEKALITLGLDQEIHLDFLKALVNITVPQSAAPLHLKLINNLSPVIAMIYYMTEVKNEPLLAIKASLDLAAYRLAFYNQYVPLNAYFAARGIK